MFLWAFMRCTITILLSNWPRTRKFSQLLQAGKAAAFDLFRHGHALVTIYVQCLCSDWSKFDRWVHAENLRSILKLVYFAEADRVLCQLVMFLTVFFHRMYKMKYNCHQDSSLIHGWFVCWVFGWEMRRLSKSSEIRFRMASSSFFTWLYMCKKVEKSQAILVLLNSFQELHLEW